MSGHSAIPQIRSILARRSNQLMAWAVGSISAGVVLWVVVYLARWTWSEAVLGAVAAQCFVWGAVDAVFAAAGLAKARRMVPAPDDAVITAIELRDAGHFVRMLAFSVKVGYVLLLLAIALLVAGAVLRAPAAAGHGLGLLVQTAFLLLFERAHLTELRRAAAPLSGTGAVARPVQGT